MDIEDHLKQDLAKEMDSLREEITRLKKLRPDTAPIENLKTTIAAEESRLLSGLLEDGPFGIALIDRQFQIAIANKMLCRMLGYTKAEIQSLRIQDVAQDPGAITQIAKQIFEEVLPVSKIEGQLLKKEGEAFWCQLTVSGLFQSSTKSKCCLILIEDISDRKWAEEEKKASETRYRELFENAYDIVYALDLDGKITSVNKAVERILGYSRAEALQMQFSQMVAPECQERSRSMIDLQIADKTPLTQDLEAITKDGSRTILEVSSCLIFRKGKPFGIQGIARNITERKNAEESLRQANKKLESWVQQLEQRTREMTLLSEMGDILRACLTTEEVYEVIVQASQELFPAQGGALFAMGPLRNIVEAVAQWGDSPRGESTFTPDECWALRRGRVHWVEDTRIGLLCKHLHSTPPRGYLCVPMMAQSEAVGVLHLAQGEDSQMPEAKQKLAMAMAEHVAMALSNLRLHETLRNQSIRDPLTGLFNRSFMEESLELELRRAVRTQHSICAIMLSLDNFQVINENYGLNTGDSILRRIGMLIQANVRKGDIACRFSGYTYVIILPQSSYEAGQTRAHALCNLARALDLKYRGEEVGFISASAGIAIFPNHGQNVESLLRSAEAALARARVVGGNCVVVAS
jgi:diguanylate cyclase (GGDEF)-like protein/PAS domain S-box-containing protein